MLNQVADGVWVRQSDWVWTNSIAVRGEAGSILVDPGIHGSELIQLADDLDRLGIPLVAGFSTHPHWDHLLWHPRFGDVPRYATPAGARLAADHAYIDALRRGEDPVDARLGPDWLLPIPQSNLEQARRR